MLQILIKIYIFNLRDGEKKKLEIPGEMVRRQNNKGVYTTYAIPSPASNETKKTHAFVARMYWRTKGYNKRKSLSPKIAEENGGDVNAASVWYNDDEYFKSTTWSCQKVHATGEAACSTNAKVEINKENNNICTIVLSKDFANATQKQGSKKSIKVSKINSSFLSPMQFQIFNFMYFRNRPRRKRLNWAAKRAVV